MVERGREKIFIIFDFSLRFWSSFPFTKIKGRREDTQFPINVYLTIHLSARSFIREQSSKRGKEPHHLAS